MRSARLLLATATATAALAIAAPGALAADGGDWDKGDSSYSKEHDKDSKHDKPHGGIHTGGGAFTAVNDDEWTKDETKDESKKKDSWGSKHEKPSGGVHTGGGALAAPGVTAGGLAALAVVGVGAYAMRRRNAADKVS